MKRLFFLLAPVALLTGCVTEHGTALPGYWAPALPTDPGARFGVLIEPTIPQVVDEK